MGCLIRIISGLNHENRAVAVIEEHSSSVSNLAAFFAENPCSRDDWYYLKSFEYWTSGFHINSRFHGWGKSQHGGKFADCFVLKNVAQSVRVYGFLCRPKLTAPDFELCVLAHVAQKKKWKTDVAELERIKILQLDLEVKQALADPNLFTRGTARVR